jgi:hypothetical protein
MFERCSPRSRAALAAVLDNGFSAQGHGLARKIQRFGSAHPTLSRFKKLSISKLGKTGISKFGKTGSGDPFSG